MSLVRSCPAGASRGINNGVVLPVAAFVLCQALLVESPGGTAVRGVINGAMAGPYVWVWLFVALMFVPLAVSLAYAWR